MCMDGYANVAHPSMTSVQTYRYEMGRRAIGMAIDAASGNRPAEPALDVGFEPSIRERTNRRLDQVAGSADAAGRA